MSQQSTLNNSRVKVEYHDPYGVFSAISVEIGSRLPLRNLNWKSPNRPLRLIDSLYIDLESADTPSGLNREDVEVSGTDGRPQSRSARKRDSDSNYPRKERRHQIPGLRQTPYLKILLLRCDDTDIYKSTSRREIREWIKLHTPPSQKSSKSSNQENHDAFEWMIVHVVLPDNDGRVVWPDRASSKILTYLRDDFNASSRTALDRIAQVPSTRVSASQDANFNVSDTAFRHQWSEAWDDALNKVKHLILASFDQRVRQYEEDIKEKGAQRAIPGWNFNTFFVLKEGLARGFESVGLVEDALSGYDELQAELDTAVRNHYSPKANGSQDATMFRDTSPEISAACKIGRGDLHAAALASFDDRILETDRKQYRDLILSSDISIFDFKTYVFARQITILRRLGTVSRTGQEQKTSFEPKYFCEICQRASAFIASTGNVLRHEVLNCLASNFDLEKLDKGTMTMLASPFVSSWVYRTCVIVLGYTDVTENMLLEIPLTRPSSARPQSSDARDKPLPLWQTSTASPVHMRALLASRRASLFRTAQRALEELATQRGWKSGWQAVLEQLRVVDSKRDGHDKNDLTPRETPQDSKPQDEAFQWRTKLSKTFESQESFRTVDAELSAKALACHVEAGDLHSAQSLQLDAALQKFIRRDFPATIQDLQQLSSVYRNEAWTGPYTHILAILCHCFRESGDDTGFVRACLELASLTSQNISSNSFPSLARISSSTEILKEAIQRSTVLNDTVELKLHDFVRNIELGAHIEHYSEGNGYSVEISMKENSLLGMKFDEIILTLKGSEESGLQQCKLFASEGEFISGSECAVQVHTTDVRLGLFTAQQLEVRIGKVCLIHDFVNDGHSARPHNQPPRPQSIGVQPLATEKKLRVWLPSSALDVSLETSEHVDLEKAKSLLLLVHSGQHSPDELTIKMKAGSSGLRLHTAQAKAIDEGIEFQEAPGTGCFRLAGLVRSSCARVLIPFQIDHDLKSISVRTEVSFNENSRHLTVEKLHRMTTLLPLGVNVQDVFKPDLLFSKFSVSSANGMPLRIVDYELEEMPGFKISFPSKTSKHHMIFAKQPATLIYRIRQDVSSNHDLVKAKLRLKIVYRCFVDEIIAAANNRLAARLAEDHLTIYSRLLQGHILSFLKSHFTRQELESMALLGQLTMPSFDKVRWHETLICLSTKEFLELQLWLERWHSNNNVIPISEAGALSNQRSISIPVDIPPMHIVQKASLRLLAQGPVVTRRVGDALPAELEISFTGKWSQKACETEQEFDFSFELESPLDTWIIGGERRGMFRAKEGERRKFTVLLLPQRSGHLPFPGLDIRLRGFVGEDRPHCELDYQSQGRSVLILPGIDSPTVGVSLGLERKSLLLQMSQ